MSNTHYIVLAIDPGYERLGISVLKKEKGKDSLMYSDCLTTKKTLPHSKRLTYLGTSLKALLLTYRPNALAIEKLFFNTNQKTALLVAEVRGVILYEAGLVNIPVYEYSPGEIKVAVTGYGKSDKLQIKAMVQRLLPIQKKIQYDDEYDAIAVGLTHMAIYRAVN
ncbi:MAG: crossover junction endodeoxyribonuclease RuvC [Patescibacteria group bacterium]